jgi:lincosamide nucleotidyltransferase A/C/D/E
MFVCYKLPVTSTDALRIIRLLQDHEIEVWVDGGWGVDALVGEQTRQHTDLDIVSLVEQLALLRAALEEHGFVEKEGGTPWNFVLQHSDGRELDVHAVRFDEEGNALYGPDGLMYPAGALTATGTIDGQQVRCKTAEGQMAHHSGYEWQRSDRHDVRVLHERLGVPILDEYLEQLQNDQA